MRVNDRRINERSDISIQFKMLNKIEYQQPTFNYK